MTDVNANNKHKLNPYWNIKFSLVLLFLLLFGIISTVSISEIVKPIDYSITEFFKTIKSPFSDLLMIIITTTSDTINLIIIGFILTVIKRTRRAGMVMLISIISIAILVTYIKPLFGVSDPHADFVPLIDLPEKFTLEKDSFMPFAQNYSYPSNHLASVTAFSFIISGLMFDRSPILSKIFLILFPATIGITKLYLFQHNLLDILGGYFLGLLIISIIVKLLKVEDFEEKDQHNQQQKISKKK